MSGAGRPGPWLAALALIAALGAGARAGAQGGAQGGAEGEAQGGAPAETVVAGLSQESIGITANFSGTSILIYGAVRRAAPEPAGHLAVIVTLEGPAGPVTIRRKSREMGIWINTESVEVASAPSFYAVATSGPVAEVLEPATDASERVTPAYALRAFAGPLEVEDARPFTAAFLRQREAAGAFRLAEGAVRFQENTLFRVDFDLPANLTEGDYKARILLLRDGKVIDRHRTAIFVRRVGLEHWLHATAHARPVAYAALALALALVAGWLASEAFRRFGR